MNFKTFLLLNEVTRIGFNVVQDKKLFGPVYHGTTPESIVGILQTGFRVTIGAPREGDTRHGYPLKEYGDTGYPPPIHHLGYGVYFTTNKNIAKDYNVQGKLYEFYLDAPRLEVINFGVPRTMMKWWRDNGYDMPPLKDVDPNQAEQLRIQATINLTNNLRSKYDAVHFKGKGLYHLLDRDQVCVYDQNRIYLFDSALNPAEQYLVGDRVKVLRLPIAVTIKGIGQKGISETWDNVLGVQSQYVFSVSISKSDVDKIRQAYYDRIRQYLATGQDNLLKMRMQNSGDPLEIAIERYADYLTSKQRLRDRFPEALIERKLAKGERVK